MGRKDYYEILGVPRTATEDEIKKAFRKASLEHHPDRQVGKSEEEKKANEEQFKEIAEAYSILGNKEKREQYDNGGGGFSVGADFGNGDNSFFHRWPGWADFLHSQGFDFDNFGNSSPFASGRPDAPSADPSSVLRKDGRNITVKVGVSILEQIMGGVKAMDVMIPKTCPTCGGARCKDISPCSHCNGTGQMRVTRTTPFSTQVTCTACSYCGGTGLSMENICETCKGKGRIGVSEHFTIEIPAGIHNTYLLKKVEGEGEGGTYGGKNGNLLFVCSLEDDPVFKLASQTGDDLTTEIFVNPLVALAGGDVEIQTPDKVQKVNVGKGLYNGEILTIANAGLLGRDGKARGRLLARVNFGTPPELSEADRKAVLDILGRQGPTEETVKLMGKYRELYEKRA